MPRQPLLQLILGEPPADAVDRLVAICERAKPLFAGEHPAVVSGALADLMAIYIAGHLAALPDSAHEAQTELLLTMHVDLVRALVEPNVKGIRERVPGVAP